MKVTRLGQHLGARIDGVDLRRLDDALFAAIEDAFHAHGVIAISDQRLDEPELIAFSRRFGALELNVASSFHHPDYPIGRPAAIRMPSTASCTAPKCSATPRATAPPIRRWQRA